MRKMLLVANVSQEHIRKFHIPFINRMKQLHWQVDVACRMDAPVPECDHAYDLPCDRNPLKGGIRKSVKMLKAIMWENAYDVVICNTLTGSIIARLAAASFPREQRKVIYINHGIHFFEGASLSRWAMGYPLEKALAPLTDVMVTINSADRKIAEKYLNIPAIEQIHGIGVDLRRFRSCEMSDTQRRDLRESLGIREADYVLSYVAEISSNKNQLALLQVFQLVHQAVPNCKLLLIGPERDDGRLSALVREQGLADSILFAGWRNDIPQLLNISDVYVASSKSEGLGLNLIEAMACGIPVVAFRNRGHCEIIDHASNGFLVDQDDTKGMANYVLQLYEDAPLRRSMVAQAQSDIDKYEIENVLSQLTDILARHT